VADGRSRRVGRVRLLREYERPCNMKEISVCDYKEVRGKIEEEGLGN
jgi:hypothetical protein